MNITINGETFDLNDRLQWAETPVAAFLSEWTDNNDFVMGHTSGSTGAPKPLQLNKAAMEASALRTNRFFGLKEGDRILLCLSTDYIAGKMMVVRAIVGGLNLVVGSTSSLPLWTGSVRFAAMVPMQVRCLMDDAAGRTRFTSIDTLIIGGSPLDCSLRQDLRKLGRPRCFVTYGMTETMSHVAVADLNETAGSLFYKALPDVTFSADKRGCLVINAPYLLAEPLVTNDVVELASATAFRWCGRWDNVVISGGIKLFPESIERHIAPFINLPFFLCGVPDAKLGSKLVMKIEGSPWNDSDLQIFKDTLKSHLGRFECPRDFIFMNKFHRTSSGKIIRA